MTALLPAIEAMAITGLQNPSDDCFAGIENLLANDANGPVAQLVAGFGLDGAATRLLALLLIAALSEPVARAVAERSGGNGLGVPAWLAHRLIPSLQQADLAASALLRRIGVVEVEPQAHRIEARLWLREAVLDRLVGAIAIEPEIASRTRQASVQPELADDDVCTQLVAALSARGPEGLSPVLLAGAIDEATMVASLARLGLRPIIFDVANLPDQPGARSELARQVSREAALEGAAVIVAGVQAAPALVADFVDCVNGHVIVLGDVTMGHFRRQIRMLTMPAAGTAGPLRRWQRALGPALVARLGSGVARVASQFRLAPAEIDAVVAQTATQLGELEPELAIAALWHACAYLPPGGMAVPGVSLVEPRYDWGDIVLQPQVEAALRRVESHVRHATTVFDDWGFDRLMGGRGRGVSALFSGASGTGKTMASEVMASSLGLKLMLIDLSQIISKYVGETSKNIAAAFDLAERTGAVMVWNEGDAIWGVRGTVGNATDRHVNAEIGDLLQRIESFRGFTVVTTNLRHAIDPAFLRRFRFMIDFPMPSEGERLRLWRQAFPPAAPVEAIEWVALARLPLSGGSIRNIALGSAFLAAEGGQKIDRALVLAELAEELRKHNLPLPAIDWGTRQ